MNSKIEQGLGAFARTDRAGLVLMRLAIAIVFLWIGGLKFAPYEADSITPFVANSPVMSFFYEHPQDYKEHMTHEGALVPAQREWQTENHTYSFSRGLGTVELMIGLLVLSYPLSKRLGLLGAFLAFVTTLVTLSFLITTPEAWVPALGDAQHGFPYLSGGGRLVVKDTMMLAGAWIIGIDAAKGILSDMHTKLAGVR
jgi:reactive chlorine resistance protein C